MRVLASNLSVVVLLLLGLEVGIRALGFEFATIARPGLTDRGVWVYDGTKGWFHQPHTSGHSNLGGPDLGIIEINSLGLRDREIALAKPDGVKRILVFGDSFVFGVGVDQSHVLSTRLGELLDASSGQRFEVINMGVSGYSTDQEYLLFRELGKALDPDLVILVVCYNDYFGNSTDFIYFKYYKPYFAMDERGRLELENAEVPRLTRWQRVKLWLGQESQLWNSMRNRRSDVPAIQDVLNFFQIAVPNRSTDREVALTASIIVEFEREAREGGVSVLVTTTAGAAGSTRAGRVARRRDLALEGSWKRRIEYLDPSARGAWWHGGNTTSEKLLATAGAFASHDLGEREAVRGEGERSPDFVGSRRAHDLLQSMASHRRHPGLAARGMRGAPRAREWVGADFQTLDAASGVAYCVEKMGGAVERGAGEQDDARRAAPGGDPPGAAGPRARAAHPAPRARSRAHRPLAGGRRPGRRDGRDGGLRGLRRARRLGEPLPRVLHSDPAAGERRVSTPRCESPASTWPTTFPISSTRRRSWFPRTSTRSRKWVSRASSTTTSCGASPTSNATSCREPSPTW